VIYCENISAAMKNLDWKTKVLRTIVTHAGLSRNAGSQVTIEMYRKAHLEGVSITTLYTLASRRRERK